MVQTTGGGKLKECYGYVRTSTNEQKKKSGPGRQLAAIERCAKTLDFEIVDTFIDDISGAKDCFQRPQFRHMISEMIKNGVKCFVVENLGRLARGSTVQDNVIVYLCAKGITLVTANNCVNVTELYHSDPTHKAMIQMQGVFFEWEKNEIVRRLKAGRERTGNRGGRPPVYPKELKTRIRRLRSRGKSYGQIADILNLEQVKTTTGNPWSPQLVRMVGIESK
jgi:DNA invertase Pin-like site-specific DNA recombinase